MFTISHLRTKIDTTFSSLSDDAQTILHKFVDSLEKDFDNIKAAIAQLEGHGYDVQPTGAVGVVGENVTADNVAAFVNSEPVPEPIEAVLQAPAVETPSSPAV